MRYLNMLAMILVVIGALNWGLWGFFQFDFVAWLFGGNTTWISRVIYAIIGLAGVWSLGFACKHCCCSKCSPSDKKMDKGSDKGSKGGCCKM